MRAKWLRRWLVGLIWFAIGRKRILVLSESGYQIHRPAADYSALAFFGCGFAGTTGAFRSFCCVLFWNSAADTYPVSDSPVIFVLGLGSGLGEMPIGELAATNCLMGTL